MTGGEGPPIARGPFLPTAESLKTYQAPEWFRDAKFGIWAHWGPQAVPRAGDWYGRPVNLASRLTSFARRGSVVVAGEVHDAAGDGYDWSFAGSRRFKGVSGEVDVYRVRSGTP